MSDCWKSYKCLKDEGYVHLTANHSITFSDNETGAHTNGIEGTWSAMKRGLPPNTAKRMFKTYLGEYMWRRRQPKGKAQARQFLKLIAEMYDVSEGTPWASSSDDESE